MAAGAAVAAALQAECKHWCLILLCPLQQPPVRRAAHLSPEVASWLPNGLAAPWRMDRMSHGMMQANGHGTANVSDMFGPQP